MKVSFLRNGMGSNLRMRVAEELDEFWNQCVQWLGWSILQLISTVFADLLQSSECSFAEVHIRRVQTRVQMF